MCTSSPFTIVAFLHKKYSKWVTWSYFLIGHYETTLPFFRMFLSSTDMNNPIFGNLYHFEKPLSLISFLTFAKIEILIISKQCSHKGANNFSPLTFPAVINYKIFRKKVQITKLNSDYFTILIEGRFTANKAINEPALHAFQGSSVIHPLIKFV